MSDLASRHSRALDRKADGAASYHRLVRIALVNRRRAE